MTGIPDVSLLRTMGGNAHCARRLLFICDIPRPSLSLLHFTTFATGNESMYPWMTTLHHQISNLLPGSTVATACLVSRDAR